MLALRFSIGVVLLCLSFVASGCAEEDESQGVPRGFVTTRGNQFMLDGREFRFVGANAAVVYGDSERASLPEVFRLIRASGGRVVRVWAHGEWDAESIGRAPNAWLAEHPFRRGEDAWNEEAFVHLDRILTEARRHDLRVQICLANWWRDTGGVAQYLAWAGVDATDASAAFGIDMERAMEFYTNAKARELYKEHVRRIVARRNSLTGELYKDDATIFGYELMNEAQSARGREGERRVWIAEMAGFIKAMDSHHLVTPGTWGYRLASERREWLADHALADVDFCDVHVYPQDDADSFIDSPQSFRHFIENRVAAALAINKPLVFGEFGAHGEYANLNQAAWFKAYLEAAVEAGANGAGVWIWTTDESRQYGITPTAVRDESLRRILADGARRFAALEDAAPPASLFEAAQYLVPHQSELKREGNQAPMPDIEKRPDGTVIYRFAPEAWTRGRFEKIGSGAGYIWGLGVGFFEFVAPASDIKDRRSVTVRAWLQPVIPVEAKGRINRTRVTLFINDYNCGSLMVGEVKPPFDGKEMMQEWRIFASRVRRLGDDKLAIRFEVEATADAPYGINISNFPEGFESGGALPVEVEVR